MNADRRMRLWCLLVERAQGGPIAVDHVCHLVTAAAGVDGAAVTVVLGATARETVYATDEVASELAELGLTLGEGPGVDAVDGGPALAVDLTGSDRLARWPMFAPAAVSAGAGAVFALPLHVGAVRVGVLELYRGQPGSLDGDQLADALLLADTACALLLDAAQPDRPQADGRRPEPISLAHPEVHQATGMITVQLGVSAAVALIRLRAYAYAHDRRLHDVAGDVVARRLRFAPDTDGGRR
ncbi:ANTAR domain-containing protein [Micromonospora sp. CPCC 206061]|uniref:ANTAR domain-containing protein n=1 Tax=Micromonospora sp. CPCC 206061 TaxID=3122410 RepID=UPI002FEFCA78